MKAGDFVGFGDLNNPRPRGRTKLAEGEVSVRKGELLAEASKRQMERYRGEREEKVEE